MSPWLSDLFLGSQSDERLVNLVRSGHERAFVAIVQRYQRQLHAFARRLGADGRSEDIVQQSFLSAFAALQAGADVRHLRGWLHQIVRNAAVKSASTPASALELGEPRAVAAQATRPLEEEVESRMLAIDTLAEISRLPSRQREALVATALNGRSRSEVADAMGLSEGAVRQLVHRARAAMRGAVTALTPYPFLRWMLTPRGAGDGSRIAELSVGGGTASAGGLALKVGAVVVSGVVATGVVTSPAGHSHRAIGVHHRASGETRITLASARPSIASRAGAAAPTAGRVALNSGLNGSQATARVGNVRKMGSARPQGQQRVDGRSGNGGVSGHDGSGLSSGDRHPGSDSSSGGGVSGSGGSDGHDSSGGSATASQTSVPTSSDGSTGSDGGSAGTSGGQTSASAPASLLTDGGHGPD